MNETYVSLVNCLWNNSDSHYRWAEYHKQIELKDKHRVRSHSTFTYEKIALPMCRSDNVFSWGSYNLQHFSSDIILTCFSYKRWQPRRDRRHWPATQRPKVQIPPSRTPPHIIWDINECIRNRQNIHMKFKFVRGRELALLHILVSSRVWIWIFC